ncbi:MAG: DoxX family protein [Bacteroidota bacterium]
MKKTNIIYWIITGIFAAFMLFSAIPDIMLSPDAVKFMAQLGYPNYFTVFIGVAKVLGAIAIVIPGFPKIKEWAYAGLMFDLIGATYSVGYSMGAKNALPMILFVALGFASYIYHHKRLSASNSK